MTAALALFSALVLGLPAPAPPVPPAGAAVRPLPAARVVAGFDPPAPDAPAWTPGHRGVDLAGSPGDAVRAALAGTVTFAGVLAGRGVVVVAHGDRRTTYEPVLARVAVGATVGAGAVIGILAPGGHCQPTACLHWGLLAGETYLDPLSLLSTVAVRLLPLS